MDHINLQLYSFGHECTLSLTEKIKTAAQMGFSGVEFARGYEDLPVETVKQALDESGAKAVSAHVMLNFMEEDIPYLAKLGVKAVFCPSAAFSNKEEAKELAEDLNRFGKMAKQHGMFVGYHNHTSEFTEDGGKYLMDWLIEYSDPDLVAFEIDCGWASAAGVDPIAYIQKHAGRIAAIHIKENSDVIGADPPRSRYDKTPQPKFDLDENGKPIFPPEFLKKIQAREKLNVAQGSGIVDWKAVKAAADAQRSDVLYVVEREANYGGKDRISCLKEDIAWLKAKI